MRMCKGLGLAVLSCWMVSAAAGDTVLLSHPANDFPHLAQKGGAVSIAWFELVPMVIAHNRSAAQPVVLRARAEGAPAALQLQMSNGGPAISLLDNGSAPDSVAGDGIYAGNVPTAEILARNTPERVNRPILGQLRPVVDGTPVAPAINVVGDVAPADLPAYPVTLRIGSPSYRFTSHVVNRRDDTFHVDFNGERTVAEILPSLGDRFDFVDLLWVPRRYVQNRFHGVIRNAIGGIGIPITNAGTLWGSPSRLKGFTMFPTIGFYDPIERGYKHEIGHQWINQLSGTLDDPHGGAHWPIGPLASDVMGFSGQGGQGQSLSCTLSRSGGVVGAQSSPQGDLFNPYELYLMGLARPEEVPASFQFSDQAAALSLVNSGINWCQGQIGLATTTLGVATITAANGVRTPAADLSQRYFKVLTLAVSVGRDLDDLEMRYLTWLALRADTPGSLPYASGLVQGVAPGLRAATLGRMRLDASLTRVFLNSFDE